ncbi:MAG: hypothetical protein AB7S99_18480, partial [Pseudodonghicola sp.]
RVICRAAIRSCIPATLPPFPNMGRWICRKGRRCLAACPPASVAVLRWAGILLFGNPDPRGRKICATETNILIFPPLCQRFDIEQVGTAYRKCQRICARRGRPRAVPDDLFNGAEAQKLPLALDCAFLLPLPLPPDTRPRNRVTPAARSFSPI